MKFAQVLEIYLNEDSPKIEGIENGPYTIQALYTDGGRKQTILATPLNLHSKYIPVVGEYVGIERGLADTIAGLGNGKQKFYYTEPLSIQKNINNNILENAGELTSRSVGAGYAAASDGFASSIIAPSSDPKNKEFVEVVNLSQLQPFSGDVIHEGRFGQSIRFGYTPNKSNARQRPTWKSTVDESPITIIRNGAGVSRGYNKFVVEDINKDSSSVWLTDKQIVSIKLSNKTTLGVTPPSTYKSPQVILNSERVIINSKKDSVIISGKKSVNISTKNWKADMDKMFNQIEQLKNQLNTLNIAITTYATTVNGIAAAAPIPFGPLAGAAGPLLTSVSQISGNIAKITSELQLMKQ